MSSRWMNVFVLSVAVLATLVLVGGCPPQETEGPTVGDLPQLPEPVPTDEPGVDTSDMEQPGAGQPAVAAAEFEWTATPTVEDIPAGPVAGMMNGKPFAAQTVRVEDNEDGTFDLQISSKALEDPDDPGGIISGDDGWELTFSMEEGTTGTMQWAVEDEKDFDQEHVYYWYARGDEGPMSVNYSWGAALEITDWTVQEPNEGSDVVGTMKGRVLLVMEDDEQSWVAGEFEAPVYVW